MAARSGAPEVVERTGTTWLSITGYGRGEPEREWVAFGDDAAAAAGLVAKAPDGTPCFCGDAIADPLTGLHAALAALATWANGGGRLLDVSLFGVAASVRGFRSDEPIASEEPAQPPRARPVRRRAPELGSDNQAVLAELGIAC